MPTLEEMKGRMRANRAAHFDAVAWDESRHPRAKDGRWGHGNGGADTATESPKTMRQKLSQKWQATTWKQKRSAAIHAPLILEHGAKAGAKAALQYVGEMWKGSGAGWSKPSKPINPDSIAGKTINGVTFAGKAVLKLAFLPWLAGQKAVEGVARAKGLSDEDAAKLRALVTCYDAVNCKAIVTGLHMTGLGHLAAASSFIPTASLAYLARATAKDFPSVAKAAATAVAKAAKEIHASYSHASSHIPGSAYFAAAEDEGGVGTAAREAVGVLADAIKRHAGDDWFFALLSHAMEHAGNAAQAIAIAERALAQTHR